MKQCFFRIACLCLVLIGCQRIDTPSPPLVSPTSLPPTIDTVYFSDTPLDDASSIDGIVLATSTDEFYRIIEDASIRIIYLDETTIDRIPNASLAALYQQGILIASLNTPLSMLAKKTGHTPKIDDLELKTDRPYFSSVLQMNHQKKHFDGEYQDFFYDFQTMHRRIEIQWKIGMCTAGIYQKSQCGEFQ